MNYGCQFVYSAPPPGYHDEDFEHTYDAVNTPALGVVLPALGVLRDIPLLLETDAPFLARGIRIGGNAVPILGWQLREPSGKILMPDYVPGFQAFLAGGLFLAPPGPFEVMTIPLEPEIECPAGGVFLLYISNPSGAPVPIAGGVVIYGVKRRANACN